MSVENRISQVNYEKYKDKGIVLYQSDKTLVFFIDGTILPSGFIKLNDDPDKAIVVGREPVGVSTGNFLVNSDFALFYHPNDKYDYVDIEFGRFIIRLYENSEETDNQYSANDGITPARIYSVKILRNYTIMFIHKDEDYINALMCSSAKPVKLVGMQLIIQERNKQLANGRTIEKDIKYNHTEQLSSFVKIILHNCNSNNKHYEAHLSRLIMEEKVNNESFTYKFDVLLKYMRKPYEDRVRIAGALCMAELDRVLNI